MGVINKELTNRAVKAAIEMGVKELEKADLRFKGTVTKMTLDHKELIKVMAQAIRNAHINTINDTPHEYINSSKILAQAALTALQDYMPAGKEYKYDTHFNPPRKEDGALREYGNVPDMRRELWSELKTLGRK